MDPSKREILSLLFPGEDASLAINILAFCQQGDSEAIAVVDTLSQ
jgi:hypothetical protein